MAAKPEPSLLIPAGRELSSGFFASDGTMLRRSPPIRSDDTARSSRMVDAAEVNKHCPGNDVSAIESLTALAIDGYVDVSFLIHSLQ